MRSYVKRLALVSRLTLTHFKIPCYVAADDSGVFTQHGKVVSIGIRVQRNRTYHGLSINVQNELRDFAKITACGMLNRPVDKVENWVSDVTSEMVFWQWVQCWKDQLQEDIQVRTTALRNLQ